MAEPRYKIERHAVKEGTVEFTELNGVGLCSRNLRNMVTFYMRQHYFKMTGRNYTCDEFSENEYLYLSYYEINKHMKSTEQPDYRMLPANVSQDVISRVVGEWSNYRKLLKKKLMGEYDGYVGLPNYSKENVPHNAIYMRATLSKKYLEQNIVNIPKTNISVKTLHADTLRQVNVSYSIGMYFIDIVYEDKSEIPAKVASDISLAIDCGVDNFLTMVANTASFTPVIFDGKEIKSINRFYNKKIAEYTEKMNETSDDFSSDAYTRKLWADRHNKLSDIMHLYSKRVLEIADRIRAGRVIIGHNDRWKDNLPMRKDVKQNFAFIPFDLFISDLKYKAEKYGIEIILQEESYTSKSSFFDDDFIPVYGTEKAEGFKASGTRVHRGLYRTKDIHFINADVNAALNILKKYMNVSSKAILAPEYMGTVMSPLRVRISELKSKDFLCKVVNRC